MVAASPTTYTPSAEALLRELEADATPDKPAQYALQELDWVDIPGRPGWHTYIAGRTLLVLEFLPGEYGYRRVLAYGHADRTAVITRDEALLFLAAHIVSTTAVPA